MADENSTPDNLVLKHLMELRNDVRGFREEMRERLLGVETQLTAVEQHMGALVLSDAHRGDQLASLTRRVERLEKRLELTD